MKTHKIEQLGNEFFITTYFNDDYTPSRTWNKSYKKRSSAEKKLQEYLELNGK